MEAVVLPVEEERIEKKPTGGMKGSKGAKCFDGEFPIGPNKGRKNTTTVHSTVLYCTVQCTVSLVQSDW